jgi:hypothetical protein
VSSKRRVDFKVWDQSNTFMKPLLPFFATCLAITSSGAQAAPPGLPADTVAQLGYSIGRI